MVLFAFFAAMAETERENIRDATGRRPPVITADMLHTVRRRRANGESVEQIRPDLIIPTGKRKGQHPPARPASTGPLPSTTKRTRTPRPSTKPRRLRRPPDEYLTARSSLVSHIRPIFGGYYGDPQSTQQRSRSASTVASGGMARPDTSASTHNR